MQELLLIALATLVSEDLTCISAGILAANGNISLPAGIFACFAGILGGDILLFLAGRLSRTSAFATRLIARCVSADSIRKMSQWLERKGALAIFGSRFVPGTRLPLYLVVGYTGRGLARFIFWFAVACAVWTPLIVGGAYFFGEGARRMLHLYQHSIFWLLVFAFACYVLLRKIFIPLFSWRGRRLLYSTWLRFTRWEFWPPYIFYIPLGFYIAYLMLRYRSFTLFTAANPAMPDGGVIGESKSAILSGLRDAGRSIARFALVSNVSGLQSFMRARKLKFPLVLKPDVGERGNGVAVIRSLAAAENYLSEKSHPVIAQEYIGGVEYGVFYFRYPSADRGQILAITDKRFPELIGDGVSTLEELILKDERAVTMARFHLKKFAARLHEVLPHGEKFSLVELGTHAKGSLFLDGRHLLTKRLSETIDGISRNFKGFYFGRYDIRAPSVAAFKAGKNLSVLELNGVTSEATSIYDPKNSLWHAYRVLARQWRIAFEIGNENRNRGVSPTSVLRLLGNILSAM